MTHMKFCLSQTALRLFLSALLAWFGTGAPPGVSAQVRVTDEVVSIGAIAGADWELFDDVRGVVPVEGGVVIADGGSLQLRSFSAAGGPPRWTFGREGDGPGEFRSIGWVGAYRADSLAVWDPRQRRATIVGPDGSLGRTFVLGGVAGASSSGPEVPAAERLQLSAAVPDGRFIAQAGEISAAPGDTTAVRRDNFEYVLLAPDGTPERSVVTLPGDEQFVWAEGTSRAVEARAFARTTSVAATSSHVVFATNESFRVTALPLGGGPVEVYEAEVSERPVLAQDVRRWKEGHAPAPNLPAFAVRNRMRLIEAMPFPETFPPHGDLVVAADGAIWLEIYPTAPDERKRWVRFGSEGAVDRFSLPPAFSLRAVDDGLAWGVETGDFDVQRVVAYRLPG